MTDEPTTNVVVQLRAEMTCKNSCRFSLSQWTNFPNLWWSLDCSENTVAQAEGNFSLLEKQCLELKVPGTLVGNEATSAWKVFKLIVSKLERVYFSKN